MKKIKLILLSLLLSIQMHAFDEFLVSDIRIIGLQRVSTGSIFNVIPISVGDKIDLMTLSDHYFPQSSLMIFKSAKTAIL